MFGVHNLPLFIGACLLLSLTPGPATMFLLSRTVAQGRNVGILSVLGVSTGTLVHVILVALGLSAILSASVAAFTFMKVAGGCYLIFLGVKALLDRKPHLTKETAGPAVPLLAYRQGFITQLLNPKLSAFMISFLPQFITVGAKGPAPLLTLGLIFIALDTTYYLGLVTVAGLATQTLLRNEPIVAAVRRAVGLVYIGLGLNLLFAKRA